MKNLYKISVLLISLMVFSCSDELDVAPDSLITVNSFWQTEDDALGGLYGMYTFFRSEAQSNLFFWGGARSEQLGYGLQAAQELERYFDNTLDQNFAGPDWKGLYTVIHSANLLLKYVPDITFSSEENKNDILAQAYAMRAYAYFIMARTWGAVPLVTEPTEGFDAETTFKERTEVEQVFELIKSDIEESLRLFPDNDFTEGRSIWSKPAVNALKGNVYLWTAKRQNGGESDFTTALSALQEINTADVGLLDNYDDVFRYTNKGNREILFAVHFEEIEVGDNYNNLLYIRDDQIPANTDEITKEKIGVGGGLNRLTPSATLRDQFSEDDSRRESTFIEVYTFEEGGTPSFYTSALMKFRGFIQAGSRLFRDDVVIYRYADVLLMIAEAKNALGQDPSAEINQVRLRAYGANFDQHVFVSGSQEQNDEAILTERLFELSFEGKRWWDLVRFGKAFELVPTLQDRASDQYLLLFPLSEQTLSLNSSLSQNPGY